ncbi:MAG: MFS transporter [Oscillospiraceae bacterium]|nr:MFS transporter [Oscillospiraceae bacterium]
MKAISNKLWNRDFSLLVFGQIISLFGNMILSFALPIYVLDISGSAALFGIVSGVPFISLLILTPIGGIIADRFRKQRVMFWLDAVTTAIIVLYLISSGLTSSVIPIIIVKLLTLNAIQGMYIPAVQASVPVLVPSEKLTSGNAAVGVVNSLSSMIGLAVAGVMYARFGLIPILVVSAICFAITAVMDLLIRIPFTPQDASGGVVNIVKSDISLSFRYITIEKPILIKSVGMLFFIILFLTSILMIGVPVIIKEHLHMGMEYVGISQSIMMVGGLIGGIIAGAIGSKLTMRKSLFIIAIGSIFIVIMGMVLIIEMPVFIAYAILTASSALLFVTIQIMNIAAITFVQTETPTQLIGKVMSLIMVLPFLAQGIGQVFYGALFEQLKNIPWVIAFTTALLVAILALFSRKLFK